MMLASKASRTAAVGRQLLARTSACSLQQQQQTVVYYNSDASSTYKPTLVERRDTEIGAGGRGSEAGLKVAIFGASGFLGPYLCTELGMLHYYETSAN